MRYEFGKMGLIRFKMKRAHLVFMYIFSDLSKQCIITLAKRLLIPWLMFAVNWEWSIDSSEVNVFANPT